MCSHEEAHSNDLHRHFPCIDDKENEIDGLNIVCYNVNFLVKCEEQTVNQNDEQDEAIEPLPFVQPHAHLAGHPATVWGARHARQEERLAHEVLVVHQLHGVTLLQTTRRLRRSGHVVLVHLSAHRRRTPHSVLGGGPGRSGYRLKGVG